jgi:hypothetical protein
MPTAAPSRRMRIEVCSGPAPAGCIKVISSEADAGSREENASKQ